MIVVALLLLLVPMLLGVTAISTLRLFQEKMVVVLVGAVVGLAVFVTLTYVVTLVLPLHLVTLAVLLTAGLVGCVVMLATTPAWSHWRSLPLDWVAIMVVVVALGLMSLIAPKLLMEQDDGLYTGIINAYGDIAWHMANITAFAEGQSFPPQNPILAGTRLTYPFLSNFLSAMFLVGQSTFSASVTLPALVLIPLLLGLVYVLTRDLAGDGNFSPWQRRSAGIMAVGLFLLGGATFGFVRFWGDWQASQQTIVAFLSHLPDRDFSGVGTDPNGFHFLNPVTTLLLPQRSFLFGLPLALVVVLLLLQRSAKLRPYVAAGVVAGLLPLFHAHTVVALIPIIVWLALIYPSRGWLIFGLVAGIVGIPQVAYYLGNTAESGSFLRFAPGWTAGEQNLVWFWLKNTGLLIPIALAGLALPLGRRVRLVGGAAFLIFLLANLWLFAPWAWDNFKLLVFWLLFVLPLISYVAVYAWQRFSWWPVRVLIVAVVALHVLSASLDVWKLTLPTASAWSEWDNESIAMAAQIKRVTKPGQSVLTAPIHNSPVVLAGRPIYLGYAAHVWSHGGRPWEREKAIPLFYEGKIEQLPETQPDYVLLGPVEKATYPAYVVRPTWKSVARSGAYELYQLP